MRQARGRDVDVEVGVRDLMEEIDAGRDILEERWSSIDGGKDGGEKNSGVLQEEESCLNAKSAEGVVMALRDDGGEASAFKFTIERRKRRGKSWQEENDDWELIKGDPELGKANVGDEWEILSVHSAPG